MLGAFYFMLLIFVHMLISLDFALSLVPGWKELHLRSSSRPYRHSGCRRDAPGDLVPHA